MKTISTVLKGILLWFTAISTILFIGGLENLMTADKWLWGLCWLDINIILGTLCYYTLSYREFYKLSGGLWLDKLIR